MTVNSTTNRVSYTRNGTASALAVSFPFQATTDLVVVETVIATGVDTVMALTTDYTVGGTPDANGFYPNGGTVTPVATKSSSYRWTIYRDPALTQLVDLVDNDPLPAASIENPVDKLTMICQRLRELSNRGLRLSEGDTGTIATLPPAVSMVNTAFHMGADGKTPTAMDVDLSELAGQIADIQEAYAALQASGSITPGLTFDTVSDDISVDTGYKFGINVAAPEAPLHVGAGSLSAEADPGIGLARAITGSSGTNCHGYVDVSTIDRAGAVGYAAFDAWSKFTGSSNYDHMAGYQARIAHQGNGVVDNMYCSYLTGTILTPASGSPGTVTNGYGQYIAGYTAGFGTLTNSYGMYIGAINSAATLNYSMYLAGTGTDGTVRMCPRVGVGTADAAVNRQFTVTTALSVGGWNSNIWAIAAQFPSIRLFATTGDKWSGIGNNDDGSLQILVGASTGTGSPTVAAAFGAAGGLLMTGATGGNKGAGTINATAVYDDNVLLTDYVFDVHLDGKLRKEDEKSAAAKAFSADVLDLGVYTEFWRTNRHLPGFISRKEWNAKSAPSVGKLAQQLWEGLEVQAVHMAALSDRIAELEAQIADIRAPWWRRALGLGPKA